MATGLDATMMLLLFLVFSLTTNLGTCQTADLSTCGSAKSCYRNPDGCDGDCNFFVTWVLTGDDLVDIEVGGSLSGGNQYIATGLSKDTGMGDDSVIDCIENGEVAPLMQMSYNPDNPARSNTLLNNPDVGFVSGSREGSFTDGQLYCKMTRTASATVDPGDEDRLFDLTESYYLLVAKGSYSSGAKTQHASRWSSSTKFNLTRANLSDVAATPTKNPLVAAHGCLMVVAWMMSCGIALLLPRYFKDAWPDSKIGGKPIWFQVHRGLMVTTLFLTIIGFIIIFVEADGYAEYAHLPSKAHPPLGIVTTILVITNPIMAAFRPNPDHPKRYIFNWAHFAVGKIAHVCAVATIFVGTKMAKSNIPEWGIYVMIAYCIWHYFLIHLCLSVYRYVTRKRNGTLEIKMEERNQQPSVNEPQQGDNKGSTVKTALLVIYALGAIGLGVALLVPISQA